MDEVEWSILVSPLLQEVIDYESHIGRNTAAARLA